jgi:tight adherence protein B
MSVNLFAPESPQSAQEIAVPVQPRRALARADYSKTPNKLPDHILSFLLGFVLGAVILYVYYKIIPLSIIGGGVFGVAYIFIGAQSAIKKRMTRLRLQFRDMLEALSVSMRAGNPPAKALLSAREDLLLLYDEKSDIITELDIVVALFNNAVPLSEAFHDFALRSGLEDVESFASIYQTIEGKSSRADEIVRQTQSIIGDKMEIEREIETLMTAAKNEMNIMTVMPLVILLMLGSVASGLLDAIYTTVGGRVAATVGLIIFVISVALGRKISNIKL